MVDRPARVVAQLYGQAGSVDQPARFSQPSRRFARHICETWKSPDALIASPRRSGAAGGPGMFPPGSEAIGSDVAGGMPIANRLCPDENLLRQNAPS
ncbi:hypothetical protein REMIM1_CH00949 [Rhizobium etli bv. mimosae str. Mim1]|nr:hypothetical protein REMIM1_CH00949 [Rhizobium etli bv. mimosae str. Mim1]